MKKNCKSHKLRHQPPWKIIFPFSIWCIWKHRNNVIFRDRSAQIDIHQDIVFRASEFQYYVLLHAWATRQWCKLDGKSPNQGGFNSTLMVQLLEIQAELEVAAFLEMTKGTRLQVSLGILASPPALLQNFGSLEIGLPPATI